MGRRQVGRRNHPRLRQHRGARERGQLQDGAVAHRRAAVRRGDSRSRRARCWRGSTPPTTKQQVAIAEAALNAQMRQLDVAEQNVIARAARRQRRGGRRAQAARIRPRADSSGQGRRHDRRARRRRHGAQAVEGGPRPRQRARGGGGEERRARSSRISSSAKAALELAKIVLGYTTLRAPFDGVILVRQAELGEVMLAGRGDRDPRGHRSRLAARLRQRDRPRQDPPGRSRRPSPPIPIPAGYPRPHLLHLVERPSSRRRASRPTPSG